MTNATRAKKALAVFLSESLRIPIYATEDLIDETQEICDRIRFSNDRSLYSTIEDAVYDYLGLSEEHCWIFRENYPCYRCEATCCSICRYGDNKQ